MSLNELLQRWIGKPSASRRSRRQARRRRGLRLTLEQLEDRHLPSSYTAASVSDLIADIKAANLAGGSNTISLVAGNTFSLTAVDNTTDGPARATVHGDTQVVVGGNDRQPRPGARPLRCGGGLHGWV